VKTSSADEVIYRAQEDLASDDKLFFDVCMEYYNENGREYDATKMNNEIKERDFIGKDFMTKPDYKFGAVLFGMGKFYVDDGKIPLRITRILPMVWIPPSWKRSTASSSLSTRTNND
jgi:hypothetical protein